jgi:uncharacterized protein YeaO (DUF488 family)
MANTKVKVRRAYEDPAQDDGTRVLVDRIWPRGLTKARAALDEWCKEIAPSTELRKWYGHDPEHFDEFSRRYQAELAEPERAGALAHLRELASGRDVTLLTATRHPEISEAAVLAKLLEAAEDPPGVASSPAVENEEIGGDSACWAHRVCPECGRLSQAEHPDACEACGAAFPAD